MYPNNITTEDVLMYFDFARRAATRSKAERLKVGAVVVTPSRGIFVGYNGTLPNTSNCCEQDGVTKLSVIHAEENCLDKMNREGVSTNGAVAFITHSPCEKCLTRMANVGILAVYYLDDYRNVDHLQSDDYKSISISKVDIEQIQPNKGTEKYV